MSASSKLKAITDRLPFALDDSQAIGAAFRRCREAEANDAKVVDMWTYAYLYVYFTKKHVRGDVRSPADMSDLISTSYEKVIENRHQIKEPSKYAPWVSRLAKNVFLNYVNRRRVDTVPVDGECTPQIREPEAEKRLDDSVGFQSILVQQALGRLPPYLRRVVKLYYFDQLTYGEIAERLDKSPATIRTYRSRAIKVLNEDERLHDALAVVYDYSDSSS